MKKFVEFSLHEYMDEHPTQQVNMKRLILIAVYTAWCVLAVYQQVCWISEGTWNAMGFLWFLMITYGSYAIYKVSKEEDGK